MKTTSNGRCSPPLRDLLPWAHAVHYLLVIDWVCQVGRTRLFALSLYSAWLETSWVGNVSLWGAASERRSETCQEKCLRRICSLLSLSQDLDSPFAAPGLAPLLAASFHFPRGLKEGFLLKPPCRLSTSLYAQGGGFLPFMAAGPCMRSGDEKLALQGSQCLSFAPHLSKPSFQITGMVTAQCCPKSVLKLLGKKPPDYY